jgi:hypothetical protein
MVIRKTRALGGIGSGLMLGQGADRRHSVDSIFMTAAPSCSR